MCGILSGIVWIALHQAWTIFKPEQIWIEGNQYLTDRAIRSLLALEYPRSLVELDPAQLRDRLIASGSVSTVKIERSLLPTHLLVRIQDLPPVARAIQPDPNRPQTVVDERGRQIPVANYNALVQNALPELQLLPPSLGTCPAWFQLYRAVRASPVAISAVDCRNPQNLVLQTEVGKVRLGKSSDEARLNSQIQQLDRLRNWPQYTDPQSVDYLDLAEPNVPKLQLKQSGTILPKLS